MFAVQANIKCQPLRQSDRHLAKSGKSGLMTAGSIGVVRPLQPWRGCIEWSCENLRIPEVLSRVKGSDVPRERRTRIGGPQPQLLHECLLLNKPMRSHGITVVDRNDGRVIQQKVLGTVEIGARGTDLHRTEVRRDLECADVKRVVVRLAQ